jgi:hypothetical protein
MIEVPGSIFPPCGAMIATGLGRQRQSMQKLSARSARGSISKFGYLSCRLACAIAAPLYPVHQSNGVLRPAVSVVLCHRPRTRIDLRGLAGTSVWCNSLRWQEVNQRLQYRNKLGKIRRRPARGFEHLNNKQKIAVLIGYHNSRRGYLHSDWSTFDV